MKLKLKPCPFCGALPVVVYCAPVDLNRFVSIECTDPDCEVNPSMVGYPEESAAESWNTRALDSERKQEVEVQDA